jgi:hypothetical protein
MGVLRLQEVLLVARARHPAVDDLDRKRPRLLGQLRDLEPLVLGQVLAGAADEPPVQDRDPVGDVPAVRGGVVHVAALEHVERVRLCGELEARVRLQARRTLRAPSLGKVDQLALQLVEKPGSGRRAGDGRLGPFGVADRRAAVGSLGRRAHQGEPQEPAGGER